MGGRPSYSVRVSDGELRRLRDEGLTLQEIAGAVGMSWSQVGNRLRQGPLDGFDRFCRRQEARVKARLERAEERIRVARMAHE